MNSMLLRPFLYLRIRHSTSTLPWMNWGVPAVIAAVTLAEFGLLAPSVNLFHASGVFDRLLGFIQSLPGFYLAALAAVATFGRPDLDELMPGTPPTAPILYHGKSRVVELTRRRFLSLLFSYLTALSIAITLTLVVGLPVVDQVRAALPSGFVAAARCLVAAPVLFFTSQLVVVTLWGLYYLGERMHTPD